MMGKPDWCPQEVWTKAVGCCMEMQIRDMNTGCVIDAEIHVARAILAAKAEEAERHRTAHTLIENKYQEARQERGKAIQLRQAAERRERLLTMNRDDWRQRALSAEAHLMSLGHVNTAHKNSEV